MAGKKKSSGKTTARKKKTGAKSKSAPKAKIRSGSRAAGKKAPRKKAQPKKVQRKKAPARKKAAVRRTTRRTPAIRHARGRAGRGLDSTSTLRGLGADAGGQSGDTAGLSRSELADSESVEELVEEGQAFEAGIVEGVENAPNADRGGVRTREVPEDDVPQEYLDED